MVGSGVLHICLMDERIEKILVIGRNSSGIEHEKLTEIIHDDFSDLSSIENRLVGFDACLFCLGTTAVGKNEEQYTRVCYDYPLHMAHTLVKLNSHMTFQYITGIGTDVTGKSRQMWARVKGKAENALKAVPFQQVFLLRLGYIHPDVPVKRVIAFYKIFSPIYPVIKWLAPSLTITMSELGRAMINLVESGYEEQTLFPKDLKIVACGNV